MPPIYPKDIPKISQKYPQDIQMISPTPRCRQDISKMSPVWSQKVNGPTCCQFSMGCEKFKKWLRWIYKSKSACKELLLELIGVSGRLFAIDQFDCYRSWRWTCKCCWRIPSKVTFSSSLLQLPPILARSPNPLHFHHHPPISQHPQMQEKVQHMQPLSTKAFQKLRRKVIKCNPCNINIGNSFVNTHSSVVFHKR